MQRLLHLQPLAGRQLRRYESGSSQPTLEVIRRMAVALGVSADLLLFAKDERGPDDELKLQFEAVSRLDPEEKKVIRSLLDSMILRHEAKRWSGTG
jgi:transcriptional regulator with XRE-family HTH domain